MPDDPGVDLCRRALRLAGAAAGVLPSCQTISSNRHYLLDAGVARELLLAVHVRLRAGQHDTRLRRDAELRPVSDARLPPTEREHGSNDNVQEPGDTGSP